MKGQSKILAFICSQCGRKVDGPPAATARTETTLRMLCDTCVPKPAVTKQ